MLRRPDGTYRRWALALLRCKDIEAYIAHLAASRDEDGEPLGLVLANGEFVALDRMLDQRGHALVDVERMEAAGFPLPGSACVFYAHLRGVRVQG